MSSKSHLDNVNCKYITLPKAPIICIAYNPLVSKYIATGHGDNDIHLWTIIDNKLNHEGIIYGHTGKL